MALKHVLPHEGRAAWPGVEVVNDLEEVLDVRRLDLVVDDGFVGLVDLAVEDEVAGVVDLMDDVGFGLTVVVMTLVLLKAVLVDVVEESFDEV